VRAMSLQEEKKVQKNKMKGENKEEDRKMKR
jgi:hypothetical protein